MHAAYKYSSSYRIVVPYSMQDNLNIKNKVVL